VRGVALGLYSEDPGFGYRALLAEIAALGASHVELVVNLYQRDGAATTLGTHTRYTIPDEGLQRAIRQARALGLASFVLPIVRLEAPRPGEWRGNLAPRDRAAWWRSYREIMLRYATLAAREHASGFLIGSELSTLDKSGDRREWQALAAAVRAVFPGRIYYSGNWDHYREVALWDLVDAVGLSAYFALADTGGAPAEALVTRWRALRQELEGYARGYQRPILFTEVGYLSQRGAAAWPWKEGASDPVDLDEQARCYRAFVEAWDGADALAGLFFWNWYGFGGTRSPGYTPRGKPAAGEIARWFGGRP
jgi:hypothetical protein